MMISPMEYSDKFLNGKDIQGVEKEITRLKRKIRELKRIAEDPQKTDSTWKMCPLPITQLKCYMEYLEEAISFLKSIGGKYEPTKSEKRAANFSSNLKHIKEISLEIGSFYDDIPYSVYFENEKVIYSDSADDKIFYCKEEFIAALDKLNIGSWRSFYHARRYGYCVFDGTHWVLRIKFDNGKLQAYSGSNAYPYNFRELCDLLMVDDCPVK